VVTDGPAERVGNRHVRRSPSTRAGGRRRTDLADLPLRLPARRALPDSGRTIWPASPTAGIRWRRSSRTARATSPAPTAPSTSTAPRRSCRVSRSAGGGSPPRSPTPRRGSPAVRSRSAAGATPRRRSEDERPRRHRPRRLTTTDGSPVANQSILINGTLRQTGATAQP
jgi:hypothetical protein